MEKEFRYIVVTAVYPAPDAKGGYIDGLIPDPDAKPVKYLMEHKEFASPEELMVYFGVTGAGDVGLMLNMRDSDASEFIRLWRAFQDGNA